MKFLAFDIEIAKEIPEGETDWKRHRPLGISCAATLRSDTVRPDLWFGPSERVGGPCKKQLAPWDCRILAAYLADQQAQGYTIVGWNSFGFDFDILAEECQDAQWRLRLTEVALDHIDIAFAMFCDKGYMISLDTAAKGMELAGKPEGMHGALAPKMWAQGREGQDKVLAYVTQDVATTADLYRALCEKGRLSWTSRSGQLNSWWLFSGGSSPNILTAREALRLPEPDTSWMSDPWKREKFYGWTGIEKSK